MAQQHRNSSTHIDKRATASEKAVSGLRSGIARIPCVGLAFLQYLWRALIDPVVTHGVEVYTCSSDATAKLAKFEMRVWKAILRISANAPCDAVHALINRDCVQTRWRKQRLGLFLRLLNAPIESWEHRAVVAHHFMQTPWYSECLEDLRVVWPGVSLLVSTGPTGPFLKSTGGWTSEGSWNSALAYGFKLNTWGWRIAADPGMRKRVKSHIHEACQQLQNSLRRSEQHNLLQRLLIQNAMSSRSKTLLMSRKLQLPGLPLDIALDSAALPHNRQALCALFTGDLFLARYACNYYAKELLPHTVAHQGQLEAAGVARESVCLHCWRSSRQSVLEDEDHVLWDCPGYLVSRTEFIDELEDATRCACIAGTADTRTSTLLSSARPTDWKALAKHVARIRQLRRKHKLTFERLAARAQNNGFKTRADAWRNQGRWVCRHGVFWLKAQGRQCPCMLATTQDSSWRNARWMCHLEVELQMLVAVPFKRSGFKHIAHLRAECARRGW